MEKRKGVIKLAESRISYTELDVHAGVDPKNVVQGASLWHMLCPCGHQFVTYDWSTAPAKWFCPMCRTLYAYVEAKKDYLEFTQERRAHVYAKREDTRKPVFDEDGVRMRWLMRHISSVGSAPGKLYFGFDVGYTGEKCLAAWMVRDIDTAREAAGDRVYAGAM